MNSKLTQIARTKVSRPTKWLLQNNILRPGVILHHGCGKAQKDTLALEAAGFLVSEYDPNHFDPLFRIKPKGLYDTTISNYVLNVLPPVKRQIVIDELRYWTRKGGDIFVTVRGSADRSIKGTPYKDGVITSKSTFQKGFTSAEAKELGTVLLDRPEMKIVRL